VQGIGASGNMLYMQTAQPHVFDEVSVDAGVNVGFWGWGTAAVDFEHDGDLDIVATNGQGSAFDDPNVLFLNNGDMTFTESAAAAGIDDEELGRGLVTFDLENDGDQDILIVPWDHQLIFYRNDLDNTNGWTRLFFDTSAVDALAPDGFGTRVHIHLSNGTTILRLLDGGSNYLSQSELSVHAGLGQSTIDAIDVMWADGHTLTLAAVPAKRTWTISARHNCPGDWNLDGALDIFDIIEYLSDLDAGHPQADLNADGAADIFDILAYLNDFASGC
ncbi:MAG: CRTAC1 family protein, partial [Phycisphaerales bacterium]|nr:CRTAC1 family protein [Phycisphaerales bacterium]